jgi:putative NIF3 family GTP cyclohydrolase 1 type 2
MLWKEFVTAFKGRAQLYWSQNLRAELGLNGEASDDEIAAAVDAVDELLARVSDADWKLIVLHHLRGQVLEVMRSGTWAQVTELLDRFRLIDAHR